MIKFCICIDIQTRSRLGQLLPVIFRKFAAELLPLIEIVMLIWALQHEKHSEALTILVYSGSDVTVCYYVKT